MTSWFENEIIQPGKLPLAVLFLAFVVTFLFIRFSTRMIRAQVKWWPGNVSGGGLGQRIAKRTAAVARTPAAITIATARFGGRGGRATATTGAGAPALRGRCICGAAQATS